MGLEDRETEKEKGGDPHSCPAFDQYSNHESHHYLYLPMPSLLPRHSSCLPAAAQGEFPGLALYLLLQSLHL